VTLPAFELPSALEAREPPESRGLTRDGVRLMIARRGRRSITHATFRDLPDVLAPGDLLVINVSATIPAAVPATRSDGEQVRVHFATRAAGLDHSWRVVELRSAAGAKSLRARTGERIRLAGGAELVLVAPYASGGRLALGRFQGASRIDDYLIEHGSPIRYGYVADNWPLEAYQNVYALTPGSAEMPSAGRPFTAELLTRLVASGVLVAPVTLHTGVSSPERREPPFPEYFEVPRHTARIVGTVREAGGRVIAVGTTVVRALETVAGPDGALSPRSGWTGLAITPERGLCAVDGLITGWHEPQASHLLMLEAAAGPELLKRSYDAALERGYLWHEFGDSHLVLP
jgi:S-adenosylmethionine:tRNA ribosyltransferase-isomerase